MGKAVLLEMGMEGRSLTVFAAGICKMGRNEGELKMAERGRDRRGLIRWVYLRYHSHPMSCSPTAGGEPLMFIINVSCSLHGCCAFTVPSLILHVTVR